MIEGKTSSGFEYHIDEAALDNMELVDAIAETETNPTALSTVLKLLLGDQRAALYDHLRDGKGRVPIAAVSQVVTEIFNSGGKEVKN